MIDENRSFYGVEKLNLKDIESLETAGSISMYGCGALALSEVAKYLPRDSSLLLHDCELPSSMRIESSGIDIEIVQGQGGCTVIAEQELRSFNLYLSPSSRVTFQAHANFEVLAAKGTADLVKNFLDDSCRCINTQNLLCWVRGSELVEGTLESIRNCLPKNSLKLVGSILSGECLPDFSDLSCDELDLGIAFWNKVTVQTGVINRLPRCFSLRLPVVFLNEEFTEFLESNESVSLVHVHSFQSVDGGTPISTFSGEISVSQTTFQAAGELSKCFPRARLTMSPQRIWPDTRMWRA